MRGRFSKEISLPVPDAPSRTRILTLMAQSLTLSAYIDFESLGRCKCAGVDVGTLSIGLDKNE